MKNRYCVITSATVQDSDQSPAIGGDYGYIRASAGANQDEMCRFCMNRYDGNMMGLFMDYFTFFIFRLSLLIRCSKKGGGVKLHRLILDR